MPYKKGGGNHLQFYDSKDGEYSEEDIKKMNETDKESLAMVHYFGLSYNELVFHWPLEKVHDFEYCDMFVKYSRKVVREYEFDFHKAIYLLTKTQKNDKSVFLESIGYKLGNYEKLIGDIYCFTDIQTLTFSRHEKGCLKCIALTVLNGKKVVTVWELMHNFKLRFITLIPGGEKIWK